MTHESAKECALKHELVKGDAKSI